MSPSQYAFDTLPPFFPSLTNEIHPIFLPPDFICPLPVPISTTQQADLKANLRPALQLATHLLLSPASLLFLSRILNPHLISPAQQILPTRPFTSQTASFVQDSLFRLASEDRIHIRFLPPTPPSPRHSPTPLSATYTPRSTSHTPHPPSYAHTQPRDFLPNGHPDYTKCTIYLHANIHRAFLHPSHTHQNPLNTTTTNSPNHPLSALFLAILLCHELIHAIHMVTRSSPPNQASPTVAPPLTTNQMISYPPSHHPSSFPPVTPRQAPTPPHSHVSPSQSLPSTPSLPSSSSSPPTEPFWSRSRPELHHRCLTAHHQPSSSTIQAAKAELGLAWELLVFGNARIEPRAGVAGVDARRGLVVGRVARKRAARSQSTYERDVDDERGGRPEKREKQTQKGKQKQKQREERKEKQEKQDKQEREERRDRFIEYAELPVQWARELFLDETWDVIDRGGLWGMRGRGRDGEWVGRERNWGVDGGEILWVPRVGRAVGR